MNNKIFIHGLVTMAFSHDAVYCWQIIIMAKMIFTPKRLQIVYVYNRRFVAL